MKLIGWALVAAAAGMTPAAGAAQQAAPAQQTAAQPGSAGAAQSPEAATAAAPSTPDDVNADAIRMTESAITPMLPEKNIGVPTGGKGIQEQVTDIGQYAAGFHNNWLLLLCALISLFVLGLLAYTMVRYRRAANPTPSRTSHNTAIEVIWTLVPVLILVAIAIPSMRLLSRQYSPPPADVTIKVTGNQWYWTYQYPDHGGFEIVSNMLKERADVKAGDRFRTDADGPPLLAVDERIVIPVGKTVKFLVTSNDVIHAFWVPAFWSKIDANPGKINETWVNVERPGVYFGQCTELCGARHAYMPIAVEVVPQAQFERWIAAKGGTMPGARPAAALVPAATPAGTPPVGEPSQPPLPSAPPANPSVPVTAEPAATN